MATAMGASGATITLPNLLLLALAGALAARGSSALNHYLEWDIDSKMPGTAGRPLPSGKIKKPRDAVAGVILLLVAVRLWAVPSAERARLVYMVSNYYLISVFSALLIAKQYPAG